MKKNKNSIQNSQIHVEGNFHLGDIINIQQQQKVKKEQRLKSDSIHDIQMLIANGKVKQALENLLQRSNALDDDLKNQVMLQSQRWNSVQKQKQLGTLSSDDAEAICNRIVYALLGIVQEMEKTT